MTQIANETYDIEATHLSDSLIPIYTSLIVANSYSIVHSITISNIISTPILVDLVVEINSSDYYVQKGIEIYPNSGFSIEKVINLKNGDRLKAMSNTANSADVIVSILKLQMSTL